MILDIIGFWYLTQDYTVIINFTLGVRVTDWLDGILVMVLPFQHLKAFFSDVSDEVLPNNVAYKKGILQTPLMFSA